MATTVPESESAVSLEQLMPSPIRHHGISDNEAHFRAY